MIFFELKQQLALYVIRYAVINLEFNTCSAQPISIDWNVSVNSVVCLVNKTKSEKQKQKQQIVHTIGKFGRNFKSKIT